METILLKQAKSDLQGIIRRAVVDRDEIVIASDDGAVVVLDQQEWSHIQETLRLISDKDSFSALLAAHALRDRGEKPAGLTPEETFRDVQS